VKPFAAALVATLVLTGCATTEATPPPAAGCDTAKAGAFVGRKADQEVAEQARRAAGAERVRVLAPDTIVTMEYLAGRLNLSVDAARTIQAVRCG